MSKVIFFLIWCIPLTLVCQYSEVAMMCVCLVTFVILLIFIPYANASLELFVSTIITACSLICRENLIKESNYPLLVIISLVIPAMVPLNVFWAQNAIRKAKIKSLGSEVKKTLPKNIHLKDEISKEIAKLKSSSNASK